MEQNNFFVKNLIVHSLIKFRFLVIFFKQQRSGAVKFKFIINDGLEKVL